MDQIFWWIGAVVTAWLGAGMAVVAVALTWEAMQRLALVPVRVLGTRKSPMQQGT